MASNRRSRIGGRLRGLIPFRRRPPAAPSAPTVVSVQSLAVRPPWWRMVARRLAEGVLPGFRAGNAPPTRPQPTYTPLTIRRIPLTSKASVFRRPARDTVLADASPSTVVGPTPPATVAGVLRRRGSMGSQSASLVTGQQSGRFASVGESPVARANAGRTGLARVRRLSDGQPSMGQPGTAQSRVGRSTVALAEVGTARPDLSQALPSLSRSGLTQDVTAQPALGWSDTAQSSVSLAAWPHWA